MKRFIIVAIILSVILIFICFSIFIMHTCSDGYNRIMISYISDEQNYKLLEVQIDDIYFINNNTEKREKYVKNTNDKVVLKNTTYFTGLEVDKLFGRSYRNVDGDGLKTPLVFLEIIEKNSKILLDRNFFDNFSANDYVKIYVSDFIYMDTDFFYIISVEHNGTTYLEKSEGLKNLCDMMEENRSWF